MSLMSQPIREPDPTRHGFTQRRELALTKRHSAPTFRSKLGPVHAQPQGELTPPGQARNPAAGPRPRRSLCVDPPAPNLLRSRARLHLSFIRVSVQCHLLQKPFPTLTLRPPPPRQPLCHLPRPSGSWNRLVRFIFRVCVWLPLLGGQRSDFSQAHGLFAPQPYLFPTLRPQARDLTSLGLAFSPVKWA